MKKFVSAIAGLAAVLMVAGCTTTEQTTTAGALIGGATGAALSGGDAGAIAIGALVGGAGGYYLGRSQERQGYCKYRDKHGRIFYDHCPGYWN